MDVLVPNNGAYCARLARIVKVLGRKLTTIDYSEAQQVSAADVDKALAADPSVASGDVHTRFLEPWLETDFKAFVASKEVA